MRVGSEIEPSGVRTRMVEDDHLGSRGQRTENRHDEEGLQPSSEAATHVHDGQDDEWPHQVELLLDGQGPGVGERGDGSRRHEVVRTRDDLPPVREVEECGERTQAEVRVEAGRGGKAHQQRHHHQHDGQGREQPSGTAQPEGRELDAVSLPVLAEQQSGDEVAGEHVEDVQAEEATPEPAHAEVVAHDDEQGHGPQSVESVDTVLAGGRRAGPQLGSRCRRRRRRRWRGGRHGDLAMVVAAAKMAGQILGESQFSKASATAGLELSA